MKNVSLTLYNARTLEQYDALEKKGLEPKLGVLGKRLVVYRSNSTSVLEKISNVFLHILSTLLIKIGLIKIDPHRIQALKTDVQDFYVMKAKVFGNNIGETIAAKEKKLSALLARMEETKKDTLALTTQQKKEVKDLEDKIELLQKQISELKSDVGQLDYKTKFEAAQKQIAELSSQVRSGSAAGDIVGAQREMQQNQSGMSTTRPVMNMNETGMNTTGSGMYTTQPGMFTTDSITGMHTRGSGMYTIQPGMFTTDPITGMYTGGSGMYTIQPGMFTTGMTMHTPGFGMNFTGPAMSPGVDPTPNNNGLTQVLAANMPKYMKGAIA